MTYEDWMKKRISHMEHITYHPLREDLRRKFNATAAWEFYKTIDKKEYGYRNLIFSWFDTMSSNSPSGFPTEAWMVVISILGKFKPAYVHMMLGEGLQMRLNITDKTLSIHQIVAEAARR